MMHRLIFLFPLLVLPGCLSLDPVEESTRYYLIGSANPASLEVGSGSDGIDLGIEVSLLADYLDRPEFVVRRGDNEVLYLTRHRWGEDLRIGLSRGVAEMIASRVPVRSLALHGGGRPEARHQVHLQLQRLDGLEDGTAILSVIWSLKIPGERGRTVQGMETWTSSWVPGDIQSLVDAHERNLTQLAEAIVRELNLP